VDLIPFIGEHLMGGGELVQKINRSFIHLSNFFLNVASGKYFKTRKQALDN